LHTRTLSTQSLQSHLSHSEDETSLSTAESPVIVARDLHPIATPLNALGLESESESSLDSMEKKQQ
jgi:hypothetical protein